LRGGKHDVWEGGFRVPYLVRWPDRVPAGTVCDETISIVDTLASIASITGHTLPKASEAAEDSHDVSKAWLAEKYESPLRPDLIVHSADGNFAIRKGGWKWIEGVPADDVKVAAKKARAVQFKRQLYQLPTDIAEAADASAQHPEVTKELEALLNRYRDGGYSRELPPAGSKAKPTAADLPPLTGEKMIDLPLDSLPQKPWTHKGAWTTRDGAVWAKANDKGTTLSGPISFKDGTIEFQIRLGEADRHSLRIHTAGNKQSFRLVLSRSHIEIAKNPSAGETETLQFTRERVKYKPAEWQTIRITFKGDELTAQVAGVTARAKHTVFAEDKVQVNFIAFEGEIGIRKLLVVR
jgi:hypothetical protein